MAHRTFTDAHGVTWEVWDVVPGRLLTARDRRAGGDRRVAPPGTPAPGAERRAGGDRRAPLAAALRGGWLAFRCDEERRRLAPIPFAWEEALESELAQYCEEAEPVTLARR